MEDDHSKQQPDDDTTTAKAPVFKNKEEHKREVNRLRSIKNERKMKMTDRMDDVLPSPGKNSLNIETYYQEDTYSEPDTTDYLNTLLGNRDEEEDAAVSQQQMRDSFSSQQEDLPPPIVASNCGTVLVGIAVAAVIAFFFRF